MHALLKKYPDGFPGSSLRKEDYTYLRREAATSSMPSLYCVSGRARPVDARDEIVALQLPGKTDRFFDERLKVNASLLYCLLAVILLIGICESRGRTHEQERTSVSQSDLVSQQ